MDRWAGSNTPNNERSDMRKIFGALFVAALMVAGLGSSAQAAADITRGGSCKLSANWQINTSVNFNNTSGSPSTGTIDYMVMNSPGNLGEGTVSWYAANGNILGSIGVGTPHGWFHRDTSKPGAVYRADPTEDDQGVLFVTGVRRVVFNPEGGANLTSCSDYSSVSTIYSAN